MLSIDTYASNFCYLIFDPCLLTVSNKEISNWIMYEFVGLLGFRVRLLEINQVLESIRQAFHHQVHIFLPHDSHLILTQFFFMLSLELFGTLCGCGAAETG